ncbi:single-stranded-DNA-specific exonuclease RecJ [Endothiovibrio diazotrophicus]
MTSQILRRSPTAEALARLPNALHPVLRRVYAGRGVAGPEDLDHSLGRLLPFSRLGGVERGAMLLAEEARRGGRVLVVGDFDADGATGAALTVRALRWMGFHADYLVPDRFRFGYGLTPEIVAVAAERAPSLIVTVDNGIASLDGVAEARRRGIRVLVTDHHLPGAELPAAEVLVNPNLAGDPFPSKHLAGVGVAFYLMAALRARLRDDGWFAEREIPEPNLGRLLDLVALGTVADVVPLDHNNRVLVEQGLARIRGAHCSPGIAALLQVAGRQRGRAAAGDLGYAVGPRLNAAGRMDDMALGVACLLADHPAEADALARQLDQLNRERREVEGEMKAQALALVERIRLDEEEGLPYGLCLFDEAWHPGVIGIVAARIKERLHRPVIAFAPNDEGELKGSARSVSALHIRDALEAVATANPGLIERFGGHAMAAGLSLRAGNLERFQSAFDEEVRRRLDAEALRGVVHSDGPLRGADLNLQLAEILALAGPWGHAFPQPLFDNAFRVLDHRALNGGHTKCRVAPEGGGPPLDAIAFGVAEEDWPADLERVHLAYRLDVNDFRGQRSAQLVVEHFEPL